MGALCRRYLDDASLRSDTPKRRQTGLPNAPPVESCLLLAGAYLAGSSECCDRVIDSYYCNGTTGCFDDDWALHMVDMGTANPWAR